MHNTAAITVTATTVTMMIDEIRREKVYSERIVHIMLYIIGTFGGDEIGGNK